jgi:hypothetical protein
LVDNRIEIIRNNNEEEPDLLIRALPLSDKDNNLEVLTVSDTKKNKKKIKLTSVGSGSGLEFKLDLKNIQNTMESSYSDRDISMKRALTDRENKFKQLLTNEKRNNSLKNLYPSTKYKRGDDSPSNVLMPKPVSSERFKIILPKDTQIATLYNVKMNLNFNNDIYNNNYLSNITTPRSSEKKTNTKALEKLYLTHKTFSKEKLIRDKLIKTPQSSGNRFYPPSPKTAVNTTSKIVLQSKDVKHSKNSSMSSTMNRNNSESKISDTSMKRNGSESKIQGGYKPKVSPSPSSTRLNILKHNDSNSLLKSGDSNSFSIDIKSSSKKSRSKKKIAS